MSARARMYSDGANKCGGHCPQAAACDGRHGLPAAPPLPPARRRRHLPGSPQGAGPRGLDPLSGAAARARGLGGGGGGGNGGLARGAQRAAHRHRLARQVRTTQGAHRGKEGCKRQQRPSICAHTCCTCACVLGCALGFAPVWGQLLEHLGKRLEPTNTRQSACPPVCACVLGRYGRIWKLALSPAPHPAGANGAQGQQQGDAAQAEQDQADPLEAIMLYSPKPSFTAGGHTCVAATWTTCAFAAVGPSAHGSRSGTLLCACHSLEATTLPDLKPY